MRITHFELDHSSFPPILKMIIHGAPHRREHIATIKAYRTALLISARSIGILNPIDYPIDMYATMVNPTSPDNDNLQTALYRALDGSTLGRESVLADDSLIQESRIKKMFTHLLEDSSAPKSAVVVDIPHWRDTVRQLRNSGKSG
jgi:hypothetical protein